VELGARAGDEIELAGALGPAKAQRRGGGGRRRRAREAVVGVARHRLIVDGGGGAGRVRAAGPRGPSRGVGARDRTEGGAVEGCGGLLGDPAGWVGFDSPVKVGWAKPSQGGNRERETQGGGRGGGARRLGW
jgi:hypothetical protein